MKLKLKCALSLVAFYCFCFTALGQYAGFQYKKPIEGPTQSWKKINVPAELFEYANDDLSDLRIIGVKNDGDTISVPFLIRRLEDKVISKEVSFNLINSAQQGEIYYYTFEIPERQAVNKIELRFKEDNFDRKIKLEASQDLEEWFTIIRDTRIVSIKNDHTQYAFTDLTFPKSIFKYYRISFQNDKVPQLTGAQVTVMDSIPGRYTSYPIVKKSIVEGKGANQTVVEITLPAKVPVSLIQAYFSDNVDFYRTVRINHLSDSVKTPKGWKYYYAPISTAIASSFKENFYHFPDVVTARLQLVIENNDNAPLTIDRINVMGNVYQLIPRFSERAEYFLLYGKEQARKPVYDLVQFEKSIPSELEEVTLGEAQKIALEEEIKANPLFENQWWLWGIMLFIILVLGWFAVKMMKN